MQKNVKSFALVPAMIQLMASIVKKIGSCKSLGIHISQVEGKLTNFCGIVYSLRIFSPANTLSLLRTIHKVHHQRRSDL